MILLTALLLGGPTIKVNPGQTFDGMRPIAFAAAPTGSQVLVTLEDGSDRIFDCKGKCCTRTLAKHPQVAMAAAWSPDGLFVATGDETARIWIENARSGAKVREFRTHTKGIQKLSFNVAGNLLISTGKDDEIKVYDISKPGAKEVQHVLGKGANFYGAAFHPKLPYTFATAILQEGGGRTYDATTGNVKNFLLGHDSQGATDIAFNPQGTLVASAGKDGTTVVMDAKTYKKIGTLKGHNDFVMAVTFSPNGKLIATSSQDGTVKVWNSTTMAEVSTIPHQTTIGSPVAFSADGNTLLTVSDQGFLQVNSVSPCQAAAAPPLPTKPAKKKRHVA